MEDNNQIKQKEVETIPAPVGLDTKGVAAPKKDTRIQTTDVLGTKGLSF
mgnify:CR=1 FL=1